MVHNSYQNGFFLDSGFHNPQIDKSDANYAQINRGKRRNVLSTEYFSQLVRKPRKGNLKDLYGRGLLSPGLLIPWCLRGNASFLWGLMPHVALDGERTESGFPPRLTLCPQKKGIKKGKLFMIWISKRFCGVPRSLFIIDNLPHV